jgi:hypothetical protein
MTETSNSSRSDLLRRKLRSGQITRDRLELAAYCGDDAAAAVVESSGEFDSLGNEEWVDGLRKWGGTVVVRAIVALARRFQCDWKPGVGAGDLDSGLCAVERWIMCPCAAHGREAIENRITAGGWGWINRYAETIPRRANMKARRAGLAGEMAALAIKELDQPGTHVNFWPQLWKLTVPMPWNKADESPAFLRLVICTELISWAIGEFDPVVERVAKCKEKGRLNS